MSGNRSRPLFALLTGLVLLAWPLLIGFGLAHDGLRWLLPLMVVVFGVRALQMRHQAGPLAVVMQRIAVVAIVLCAASYLLKTHQLLLFYPVVVNGVMLAVFGGSLWSTMPIVERIARLREPELTPAGVRYTRRVTQVWCLFFIINGTIALLTALHGDMSLWTIWNGMIAYLLMGTLMAVEWLVRQRVRRREKP
ncbi:hypothetical protein AB4K05_19440 [Kluyvera sp. STS39-E]|uniref:hypothetical protein n=1 Tax=Kluyvera sp. STS39-E TaxID=3234748 RepID=UPI0034C5BEA4